MSAELLLREFERIGDGAGTIGRLRRLILDLAVRGDLTLPSATDEPARELVSAAAAKIATSSNRRRSGIVAQPDPQSPAFALRSTWEWAAVRQITRNRGQTVPTTAFTYIDVTSIDKEAGLIGSPAIVAAADAPSRARKVVAEGDVLFSCVRPYLLNIAIVDKPISPAPIASTAFAVLDGMGLVEPRYLWTVLRSPYFVRAVEAKMRGQAYPAINDSDLAKLLIPLPPLAEQHRIVARVGELMAIIDELAAAQIERESRRDRLRTMSLKALVRADDPAPKESARVFISNLSRMIIKPEHVAAIRRTVLDLAVRGRLVAQDTTGTRNRTLADLCSQVTDGTHKTPTYVQTGVPFISTKDFSGGRLSFASTRFIPPEEHAQLIKRCRPERGDVLLGRIGTLGKPVVIDVDREFSLFVSVGLLKPRRDVISSEYLCLFLASNVADAEYDRIKVGAGTHTNKLNLGDLKTVMVPTPSLDEQHRIVGRVKELMAACDALETSLAIEQIERSRLLAARLHQALNGASDEGSTEAGAP